MFTKILIANRGEIACRIIKTARRMGIATVAVYSDADRDARHVADADEAVHIGGAVAAQSYLDGEKIIAACKQTGAEAVHPGYGFLSENASFARRLEQAGIVFIGPGADAIEAMGDKITSKLVAKKAGVNTIPGHTEVVADAVQAVKISGEIGYPVMIKASAGGGGKGMRVAYHRNEVETGFERATSEALSSFGDGRILIEKFIEQPRHIEIQLLADSHGNVVTLNERECSIQRRHQKVIEEAPSVFIDKATRAAMSAQAIALATAVDYRSAGTVEMVVDAERKFYFLEMNTRLQVEHPVTEMITGVDLVELMIRVAAGEKLPIKQADVGIDGWAMEARIYAENPFRNFLPSSGRLVRYLSPVKDADDIDDVNENTQVRVDTGVEEGSEISMFYDPMIAKLVTWGEDRKAAIEQMQRALDAYYIRGVDTNLPFVSAIMAHPRFQKGDLSTNFIEQEYPDGFARENTAQMQRREVGLFAAFAAIIHYRLYKREKVSSGQRSESEPISNRDWVVVMDGEHYPASVSPLTGDDRDWDHWLVECCGELYTIDDRWRENDPIYYATLGKNTGKDGDADEVEHQNFAIQNFAIQLERRDCEYILTYRRYKITAKVLSPRTAELHALMPIKAPPDKSELLLSPMPGLLVSLAVEAGSTVKAGQQLAVIEAMKMENALRAEHDGVVKKVLVKTDTTVEVDQPIMEFENPAPA